MASSTAIFKKRKCWLIIFAFLVTRIFCVSANVLTISLDRATEDYLLIDVKCGNFCENEFTWQHKSTLDTKWNTHRDVRRHRENSNAFYIVGLQRNSTHYVRIYLRDYDITSNILMENTCPETPPPVADLHAAAAGAGWLDVRWTQPRESCKSYFEYSVLYRAEAGAGAGAARYVSRRFGYIDTPGLFAVARPHHPCASFPREFCVLLTDHVVPGANHTVKVYVTRIDARNLLRSDAASILVFADPEYTGPVEGVSQCPNENITDTVHLPTEPPNAALVVLPLWVVVVTAVVIVLILTAIIIFCIVVSIRCRRAELLIHSGSKATNHNNESQPVRYVKDCELLENRSNQKEEDENPVYEDIDTFKSEKLYQNVRPQASWNIYG